MGYLNTNRSAQGFAGSCGPSCRCPRCRLTQAQLGERYVPDDDSEPPQPPPTRPAGPSAPGGLAGSVYAEHPHTRARCQADERRIRPIVEPPASELATIAPRHLADPRQARQMHRAAYAAYQRLKAAAEADGIPANLLTIVSAHRGIAHQRRLWETALRRYGSPQAARRWVAPPGGSAHHTGRAIDLWLGMRNSSDNINALRATLPYKWMVCNAARFGFFPYANEPWHWEYNPEAQPSTGSGPSSQRSPARLAAARSMAGAETQLVRDALAKGVRDPSRLTNLVFDARHPERRGQPIRRGERSLAREWLDIRDRLIRPLLNQAPAAVPRAVVRDGRTGRPTPASPGTELDPRRQLDRVHPELARRIAQMADALAGRGIRIRVTSGLRTFAEQDALYAQGRTAPGNIVTRARGGQSNHNYGLAADVVPLVNSRPDWNAAPATWQAIGEAGRRAGLSWGGDWKGFVDRPHFELPVGMGVKECLRIYQQGGGLNAVWAEASRRLRQVA